MIERQKDNIDEQYQGFVTESLEGDKLAMKLMKQFDKMIAAEVKKAKLEGIEKDRLTQWVQWKISRAWGR